ncbi:MAG TPA: RNA-binding protein [Candidatus Nanoarchaeia archaeon]|nr:RNA-binding protein [Candidatus Nanoarchaeia archaeon]
MSKKLYVGNLSFSVDDSKLRDIFSSYGEIEEATVIIDKFSKRSKGFGFVTFKNDEDADKAVEEMNGKEVEGRTLKVNEAKPFDPDAPRPQRSFGGGGGFGGRQRRF